MGDLLQKLLNDVVVTPYDPNITSRLAVVCDEMAAEVKVDTIDRYIASFVFNKPDWDFKQEVEEKYAKTYPDEDSLVLPPLFAIVLAQTITIYAITNKLTGMDQAVASLILMNYLLYRKGSLTKLILPNHLSEMFYKMDSYIDGKDNLEITGDKEHLASILSNPDFLMENYNNEMIRREVRELAKMAILYKRQAITDKYKQRQGENAFVKVYEYLCEVIEEGKWPFLKNDIKRILLDVTTEAEQKKQATIEGIIGELTKAKVDLPYDSLEESSLILKFIAKDEEIPVELKSKRLTVMEFGVYVYYELLLEHIICEYYGSRESA